MNVKLNIRYDWIDDTHTKHFINWLSQNTLWVWLFEEFGSQTGKRHLCGLGEFKLTEKDISKKDPLKRLRDQITDSRHAYQHKAGIAPGRNEYSIAYPKHQTNEAYLAKGKKLFYSNNVNQLEINRLLSLVYVQPEGKHFQKDLINYVDSIIHPSDRDKPSRVIEPVLDFYIEHSKVFDDMIIRRSMYLYLARTDYRGKIKQLILEKFI